MSSNPSHTMSATWNDPHPAVLPETSVFRLPGHLQDRYRQIVVISHARHLAKLDLSDPTSLIVSTDWLVWRAAVSAGAHCIHYEAMLDHWPDDCGDPCTHHQRSCEWVYDANSNDMTMFDGVSLGKHFVRDVTIFANAWRRMWYALARAVETWKPDILVLIDAHAEHNILDHDNKCALATGLAEKYGITSVVRLDVPDKSEGGYSERDDGIGTPDVEPRWRVFARSIYAGVVNAAFRLRWHLAGRPSTQFIYSNTSTEIELIAAHEPGSTSPLFLAGPLPKSWRFLMLCWRKGVRLSRLPKAVLTSSDQASLARIEQRISTVFAERSDPHDRALGEFLHKRIVSTGWLRPVALEIKKYKAFLKENNVARVVVGDATGHIRIIAESASVIGVPADELVNGMFVVPQRYDARCGDKGRPALLDRVLTWGAQNEDWLRACKASVGVCRTGYPALESFRKRTFRKIMGPPRNALVLPIYVDADDVMALTANIFTYLCDTIHALRDAGIENIRVKVHGGPQNLDYYRDVVRSTGVLCEIVKGGAIDPHFEWADIVVGPANSGAFIEANAAGLPYYAYRPWPSLIDTNLFEGMNILATPQDLTQMLATGRFPDRGYILSRVASFDEIPDAGRQTWQALTGGFSGANTNSISTSLQESAAS